MRGKINVRAVVAFILCNLIGIAVIIILGHNPLDILAAIAFWIVFLLIIHLMDKLGFGKYFGGKP